MKTRMLLVLSMLCTILPAQQTGPDDPRYTSDGQLMRPEKYREWIYLSSGLGMTYGAPIAEADAKAIADYLAQTY